MSILNVSNLSHGFGDRAIFENVSFRLLAGEHIGLVGANGEGKSTFMNIITGKTMPDFGSIEWAKNCRPGYLTQHSELDPDMSIRDVLSSAFLPLFEFEKRLDSLYIEMGTADDDKMTELMEEVGVLQDLLTHHDFYLIDSKVEEVGRALGLSEFGLDTPISRLSGGGKTKVLLAKLLLEKPDVLLLDEPTNYLDKEHIVWLSNYLKEYENAFILISHDLTFLNDVTNIIYHMHNRELNRYVGNYKNFETVFSAKQAQLEAAYTRQQKEIASLKDFVARNKARVSTRNMAKSRQKKLDKMDIIELDKEQIKPSFNFNYSRLSSKLIFETNELVIGYSTPLSKPLNILMERGEKLVIEGANGIGKTTLIKSLMGLIPALTGSVELGDSLDIGYFKQEEEALSKTCIEDVWEAFPSFTQYEVRSALSKCGLTTRHLESMVKVLSGGEQAKVRLCKIINQKTNLLILDEPTNHLDKLAKEALKEALILYPGSILMVCHEEEFYDGLATRILDLSKWTTTL